MINTLLMSIICMGIVTVQWNLVGYSWAFGPAAGNHGAWGNFDWAVLRFPPAYTDPAGFYAPTYPLSIHSAFQCAFAVITPALISGSIIGRMKFIPYCDRHTHVHMHNPRSYPLWAVAPPTPPLVCIDPSPGPTPPPPPPLDASRCSCLISIATCGL